MSRFSLPSRESLSRGGLSLTLTTSINVGLEGNRDFINGRKMFGAASCFACHRFNQEGGAIGPDLTSVAGKFSPRDLLESIIEPGKEISDQYGQMIFEMKDGTVRNRAHHEPVR